MEENCFMPVSPPHLRRANEPASQAAGCALFPVRQPSSWVDTHVFRTSRRLGLIGPNVNVDQAHTVFAKITPLEWVYPLHVNLITHGRRICHAQRPDCVNCSLYQECAYVGSVNAQETAFSG